MQALIIIAVIAIGVLWVIAKIFEGLSDVASQMARDSERNRDLKAKEIQSQRRAKKNQLATLINIYLPQELPKIKSEIAQIRGDIEAGPSKPEASEPYWTAREYIPYEDIRKRTTTRKIWVSDIDDILTPNKTPWIKVEEELVSSRCKYPENAPRASQVQCKKYPLFKTQLKEAVFEYDTKEISEDDVRNYFSDERIAVEKYNRERLELVPILERLNEEISAYNAQAEVLYEEYLRDCSKLEKKTLAKFEQASENYLNECKKQKTFFKKNLEGYKNAEKNAVTRRLDYVLNDITLPNCIPHTWDVDFNPEEGIALVEIGLPDVVHQPPVKEVELKSGFVEKPLNQAEKKEVIPNIHPAILLRVAYEVFRNDTAGTIKLLVLNGWIKFDDPSTGVNTKAYTASLMVEKSQIENINLRKVEPLIAFMNLKGKSAGKLVEVIPVTPVMSLDRKDKRFVATSEVLNKLGSETNLASMDWKDFESLIAELFEKEFAKEGAEVKVTQASRDRGVDAVIFDPDPIRGGKIIVQAKRYAHTVDVSAVRDLCAVVKKEGAIKGILVTTSTFGGDAYQFANNEPVALLNGAELLGLLKKHGYTFRISLDEAKKLNLANLKQKK